MQNSSLYRDSTHQNLLIRLSSPGEPSVQDNQHLVLHGASAMLIDPISSRAQSDVFERTSSLIEDRTLRYVFLSHQDPDIVAATNGWLMASEADVYISKLWTGHVAHFGIDHFASRVKPIRDQGMIFDLDGCAIIAIPAHFLHSQGNFHLYDPTSKILYTGDLGSSFGADYDTVHEFNSHLPFIEEFHRRNMGSSHAMKAWADMVLSLEIEIIAPRYGAMYSGKEVVRGFVNWCAELQCGVDVIAPLFKPPAG